MDKRIGNVAADHPFERQQAHKTLARRRSRMMALQARKGG